MNKLDMDRPYLITQAQRMDLLNSYNKLRDALQTIWDCHDIWLSDVRHLENLQIELQRTLKFVPKRDDDRNVIFGADWVLMNTAEMTTMTKRFYIDVTFTAFNGKLSIDIDAASEKQAWEAVDTMLFGRLYQLKTTSVVNLPWQRETSDD